MTFLPQKMQGMGAALQDASPLLMAMSQSLLSGNNAFAGAPMGLAAMKKAQQKREGDALLASLMGGGTPGTFPSQPGKGATFSNPADMTPLNVGKVETADLNSPEVIAADAMRAIGAGDVGQRLMSDLMNDFNLSQDQAAGIVGNLSHESGGFKTLQEERPVVPGSRGGFGYAQWTGPRRRAFEKWAQDKGLDPKSYDANYGFLKHELTQTPERGVLANLAGAQNYQDAAQVFSEQFLRPGIPHMESRLRRAGRYAGGEAPPESSSGVQVAQSGGMDASRIAQILQHPGVSQEAKQFALMQWKAAQSGAGGTDYSLTPQYITTPDGGLEMIQLGKDGSVNRVQLPEGAAIKKGVEKLDLGTHFQWHNTITGEPIGEPIAKNLAGAEQQKAEGKIAGTASGEAKLNVGSAVAQAQNMIDLIDSIAADPALGSITGMVQGRLPPMTQAGTDLFTRIEQLQGKAFLEAFETLKGGGQITEREGIAAQNAIARLQRAQSTDAYIEALMDLRAVVEKGVARARSKAGQAPAPSPSSAPGASTPSASDPLGLFP